MLHVPGSLPDVRVLAGVAEEMGVRLGFRTPEQAWDELGQLGGWDGERPTLDHVDPPPAGERADLVLASWKQLIDDGRLQDGDDDYRATARAPRVLVSRDVLDQLGAPLGAQVTLTGPLGSVQLPLGVADLAEGTCWAPASAPGASVRHLVGPAGSAVSLTYGGES